MKTTISIVVKGKTKTYDFHFKGDPKYIPEWEEQGLEVAEVLNSIPEWAVRAGLLRPWIAVQDFWRWLRLF
ncbi:hypothetical protein GCM10027082_24070 [Comamonas humi]